MDMVTVNIQKTSLTIDATSDIKDDYSITNGDMTLTFGPMGVETLNGKPFTNELLWFNSSQGDVLFFSKYTMNHDMEISGYGVSSGFYVFRPNQTEPISISSRPEVKIFKGSNVEFAEVTWDTWATQVYRLWRSNEGQSPLEVEWTVGPIPISEKCSWNPIRGCHWGKEIISRYRFG